MSSDEHVIDPPDVVSVGRISVDLYGEQIGSDLATSATFRRFVGGSAANIAIGSARLGLRTAMIARTGGDAMGDYLVSELEHENIATGAVTRDDERGAGVIALALHEGKDFPRSFLVHDPAEFALTEDDIDVDLVGSARSVVLTGSLLAKPNLRAATHRVVDAAAVRRTSVIFDIDYRPAFWGVVPRSSGENLETLTPEVTAHLQSPLKHCDVVIGTQPEVRALGGDDDLLQSLKNIRAQTHAVIVLKVGPQGCYAFPGDIPSRIEDGIYAAGYPVEVMNSVGAGDAFMAGFLRGHLGGEELATSLDWANACGAIVVSRLGCSGDCPSMEELQQFLESNRERGRQAGRVCSVPGREWRAATSTRYRDRDELFVLALDHRGHLERLAADSARSPSDIARLKEIVIETFLDRAAGRESRGILTDDVYVSSHLRERIVESGVWNARALEVSGRAPVRLNQHEDVAAFINSWPKDTVVKVLVATSPRDDTMIKTINEARLRNLAAVCHERQRDLLIEILPSAGSSNDGEDLLELLEDWYRAGVRPAWWKLPDVATADEWKKIARTVERYDKHCRGILLLGGATTDEGLSERLSSASGSAMFKGFAIGRPIFHQPAASWFKGEIGDRELGDQVLANYERLIEAWG